MLQPEPQLQSGQPHLQPAPVALPLLQLAPAGPPSGRGGSQARTLLKRRALAGQPNATAVSNSKAAGERSRRQAASSAGGGAAAPANASAAEPMAVDRRGVSPAGIPAASEGEGPHPPARTGEVPEVDAAALAMPLPRPSEGQAAPLMQLPGPSSGPNVVGEHSVVDLTDLTEDPAAAAEVCSPSPRSRTARGTKGAEGTRGVEEGVGTEEPAAAAASLPLPPGHPSQAREVPAAEMELAEELAELRDAADPDAMHLAMFGGEIRGITSVAPLVPFLRDAARAPLAMAAAWALPASTKKLRGKKAEDEARVAAASAAACLRFRELRNSHSGINRPP